MKSPFDLLQKFISLMRSEGLRPAWARAAEYLEIVYNARGRRGAKHPPAPRTREFRHTGTTTSERILISIIMPVYNPPPLVLEEAIQSILDQDYTLWELCICDDCSTDPDVVEMLERYRGFDTRIKITKSPRNLHIADATNLAAEFATGEFVAFLDHDDVLLPNALTEIVSILSQNPVIDVLYTDEDKLNEDGTRSEPYFKPDWSPEHLASVAYILHFMVVRKSLFLDVGGLRGAFTGAQDYDLSLRVTAKARCVSHAPGVLYHWRKVAGSAAGTVDAKPTALINAKKALEDFVKSQDKEARVDPGLFTGSFRVRWSLDHKEPVTLLMLTDSRRKRVEGRGDILMVEHAINSILDRSSYKNIKIVVLDNGRMPQDTTRRLMRRGVKIKKYNFIPPFNYSTKLNAGFDLVQTEDVIILNDDIEVISEDWIEALLEQSRRPEIGAVGARLLYPTGHVQHAGVVLGVNGVSAHIFHGLPRDYISYCGYSHVVKNYSAVTGAVMATRMSLVRALQGFDEQLAVDYNDIDFCLRLGAMGLRIVYTPYAQLYHFEGSSLARKAVSESDQSNFLARWSEVVRADPFYNLSLPHDRTDCAVYRW